MSDSISGNLTDLATETTKQVVNLPVSIIKGIIPQAVEKDTEEEEARKRTEKIMTFNRIKEIEAEMERLRREDEKKTGPEVKTSQERSSENTQQQPGRKQIDEASRQAVGRAEQGRNFKG